MAKRSDLTPSSPDHPDLQRRRITQLIAAVTVLGTGLGVNMREVFAAEAPPEATALKGELKASPSASGIKWEKGQPPHSLQFKSSAPANPAATQVKPVPAQPASVPEMHVPPAEYGKITRTK